MEVHSSRKNELVKFQKLKMKYFQNEDIKVEYVLGPQVRQWPRDWIGLYPSDWNNLQQYITFEWAVWRPCDEKSHIRTEIFKHKYHSEAVSIDKQYQFVYVNKHMKVLGSSALFGFLPPIPFSGVVKSDVSMLQSQRNGLKRAPNVYKLLKPTIPPLKLSDQLPVTLNIEPTATQHIPQKPLQELQKSQMQLSNSNNASQGSQTDMCLPVVDLPNSKQGTELKAPSQLNEEESSNLCESESINKEMLVKCVQSMDNEDEQSSVPQPNSIKETPKERRLKAVIGFQEQTIQELQHRLACVLKEHESSKESKPDEENQLGSSEPEPLFTTVHKNIPRTTGISEMNADDMSEQNNETFNNLNDVIVSNIDESESQTCIRGTEVADVQDEECAIQGTFADSVASASGESCNEPPGSALTVSEKTMESGCAPETEVTNKADSNTASGETEKVEVVTSAISPTSVVIRGEKVSFSVVK